MCSTTTVDRSYPSNDHDVVIPPEPHASPELVVYPQADHGPSQDGHDPAQHVDLGLYVAVLGRELDDDRRRARRLGQRGQQRVGKRGVHDVRSFP